MLKGICGEGVCGRHPLMQRQTPTLRPRDKPPAPRGRHLPKDTPVETATEVGGTHPTGMHSSLVVVMTTLSVAKVS